MANVNAGSYVNGSDASCSVIAADGFATSVTDLYLIGADAWSKSQVIGKETGGDGGAATEVSGVADDGTGGGEGLDEGEVGGRVTKVARSEPAIPGQCVAPAKESSCVWAGKDSGFEFLR